MVDDSSVQRSDTAGPLLAGGRQGSIGHARSDRVLSMTLLRRWRWGWRWLWAGLLVLAVVVLGLVLGLPPLLKQQIETRGSAALGRAVTLARVEFALHRLAVTLHGLAVAAAPADANPAPQLAIDRVHLDISLRSLWRLAPVVEALTVEGPRLRLARLADGRLDVDDIVARLQAAPAPATPPPEPARFALFNLQLSGGELTLDDRRVARTHPGPGAAGGAAFPVEPARGHPGAGGSRAWPSGWPAPRST